MRKYIHSAGGTSRDRAVRAPGFLILVVFLAGIGTLGIEMVASRLLAPFFGTSQMIWAVIIGMTLAYLALGYRLGGALADRSPNEHTLYQILCWAGFLTGLLPVFARPLLFMARTITVGVWQGGIFGATVGMLGLFTLPLILMAMVSPFAIRLQLKRAETGISGAGTVAGSLSAISTIGSIVGTFLTVLVLMPMLGTAWTVSLIALLLLSLGLIGLRDWRYVVLLLVLGVVLLVTQLS